MLKSSRGRPPRVSHLRFLRETYAGLRRFLANSILVCLAACVRWILSSYLCPDLSFSPVDQRFTNVYHVQEFVNFARSYRADWAVPLLHWQLQRWTDASRLVLLYFSLHLILLNTSIRTTDPKGQAWSYAGAGPSFLRRPRRELRSFASLKLTEHEPVVRAEIGTILTKVEDAHQKSSSSRLTEEDFAVKRLIYHGRVGSARWVRDSLEHFEGRPGNRSWRLKSQSWSQKEWTSITTAATITRVLASTIARPWSNR